MNMVQTHIIKALGTFSNTERSGQIETTARVGTKVSPGETWIPFHFQDGNANWLTNVALDKFAKAPEYKVCAIKIEKVKEAEVVL